ncbi:hypothetical protein KQ51_01415 [Candidatus Izimaplasma bacterium HR1]|jgi:hypothetical protein|uniref:hypothetical protein n=1 Tax=Candidatus Izimoplasma sp. HR1 TaxID=1541959 RepID=UPI0004F5A9AD|nr:hypothetical protein KQ51_01415 [Candidatus Izimaplasma bacterium HR1]
MQGIREGFAIYKKNFIFIFKHPFTLIPFLLALGASIFAGIYVNSVFDLDSLSIVQLLGLVYLLTIVSTFSISVASLFILELLEQHETTGKMRPLKALADMLTKDLWRALPIIIVWSIIDFIITLILAVFSALRKNKNGRTTRPAGPLERAVRILQTTVRMGMMVIFTVIAWDDKGPKASFDEGMKVYKNSLATMLTGVGVSEITAIILIVPLILVQLLSKFVYIPIDIFLPATYIYLAVSWSIGKLIEQLYVSELYLWNIHYEKALENNENITSIYDVRKPSFTDNSFDLLDQ